MYQITINLIEILVTSFVLIYITIYISKKFDLLDHPRKGKHHLYPVPFTGGLVIAILLLYVDQRFNLKGLNINLNLILSHSIVITILGLIDDIKDIKPLTKIFLQFFPIFALADTIYLGNLGYYEFLGFVSLGSFSKIFTILCCLLYINAFNYIDGIDGLGSSITFITLNTFLIYLVINKYYIFNYNLYILSIPFIVFTFFNTSFMKLPKIFLGNAGSNLCGFFIAFLAISLAQKKLLEPALIIWPLALVVYEFLSTNIIRIKNKKKLFLSGKDHIQFIIKTKFNLSNSTTVLLLVIFQILFSLLGILIYNKLNNFSSILAYIIFFIIYLNFRSRIYVKKN